MIKALIAGLCLCSSAALAVSQDDFQDLAGKCAPDVSFDTLQAIVQTESGFNEFAIGVVGGAVRQPESKADAEMAIKALDAAGVNYSVGLGQINRSNFAALGLTASDALSPAGTSGQLRQSLKYVIASTKILPAPYPATSPETI